MLIKPKHLIKKDRVAIVAPSMAAKKDVVNRAVKTVRQLGLNPCVYASCYLADSGEQPSAEMRAKDIMDAFTDGNIKGIISLRAGYGTLEVLDLLDYDVIKNNAKVFVGFSDVTALLLAINKYSDLISFHGPLATTNMRIKTPSGTQIDGYTMEYWEKILFSNNVIGTIENPSGEDVEILRSGQASGTITGGNLSLLYQTLGTKYEVDTKGKILFFEDFGESLESIHKMLVALRDARKFSDCNGVLVGPWIQCASEQNPDERWKAIKECILRTIEIKDKPVLANIRSGHDVPMLTLPMGGHITINADNKQMVLDSSVMS